MIERSPPTPVAMLLAWAFLVGMFSGFMISLRFVFGLTWVFLLSFLGVFA